MDFLCFIIWNFVVWIYIFFLLLFVRSSSSCCFFYFFFNFFGCCFLKNFWCGSFFCVLEMFMFCRSLFLCWGELLFEFVSKGCWCCSCVVLVLLRGLCDLYWRYLFLVFFCGWYSYLGFDFVLFWLEWILLCYCLIVFFWWFWIGIEDGFYNECCEDCLRSVGWEEEW